MPPNQPTAFRSVISIGDDSGCNISAIASFSVNVVSDDGVGILFTILVSRLVSETSSLDKVSSDVDNLFLFDFELKSSYCLQGAPTVDTQKTTSTHSSSQSENYDRNLALEYRTLFKCKISKIRLLKRSYGRYDHLWTDLNPFTANQKVQVKILKRVLS
ncbi:hypothetical protein FF38_07472 [Lucilia cuprina]|uniref:Uncharacterized protein n=1 Tax=Lucilia cuprina TaxID=7375 RepID=A0A0L0CBI3_LUCCU|nr:hypothetical protein FF38_07472 [Lucilia cuprina]